MMVKIYTCTMNMAIDLFIETRVASQYGESNER